MKTEKMLWKIRWHTKRAHLEYKGHEDYKRILQIHHERFYIPGGKGGIKIEKGENEEDSQVSNKLSMNSTDSKILVTEDMPLFYISLRKKKYCQVNFNASSTIRYTLSSEMLQFEKHVYLKSLNWNTVFCQVIPHGPFNSIFPLVNVLEWIVISTYFVCILADLQFYYLLFISKQVA